MIRGSCGVVLCMVSQTRVHWLEPVPLRSRLMLAVGLESAHSWLSTWGDLSSIDQPMCDVAPSAIHLHLPAAAGVRH